VTGLLTSVCRNVFINGTFCKEEEEKDKSLYLPLFPVDSGTLSSGREGIGLPLDSQIWGEGYT